MMFCSCTWIFGKFASIYQTWITTQSSIKSTPSCIWPFHLDFILTQLVNDLYLISASVQSHADSANRQYSQGVAVPMQRVMSCHKLWDKLCQCWWWGHWATCETLPLSPLWQQLTCTSQRQFRGCLSLVSGEEKSWNFCSGYSSRTCEFVPERALAQFIAFGAPDRSPHATLCQLILAQFWV